MARISTPSPARAGISMVLGSMSCVQVGIAVSVDLSTRVGAEDVAWLRLVWAAVILVVAVRPWRATFNRSALLTCVSLGAITAAMTLLYMAAVVRLPLGTASALEFLGPLGVAVARGSGRGRLWALLAAAGVVALTDPWQGMANPVGVLFALGAGAGWAAYIILTQRAGQAVTGLNALAVSMPAAAVVATIAAAPSLPGRLTWPIVIAGLGLGLLLPVIPFSLELLALRRLHAAVFGTFMSLEPVIAVAVGLIVLGQVPTAAAFVGILLVVAASIGAERSNRPVETELERTLAFDAGAARPQGRDL